MATGKSGILGKLKGSLDGVTLYNLKGVQVIRKKAVSVYNPESPAQIASRANMRFAISIFNQLKGFLHYSLASRKPKQSLLSEFLRLNLNKSIVNSTLDFDKLIYYSSSQEKTTVEINDDDLNAGIINGTII
jgi:hypothetical protein